MSITGARDRPVSPAQRGVAGIRSKHRNPPPSSRPVILWQLHGRGLFGFVFRGIGRGVSAWTGAIHVVLALTRCGWLIHSWCGWLVHARLLIARCAGRFRRFHVRSVRGFGRRGRVRSFRCGGLLHGVFLLALHTCAAAGDTLDHLAFGRNDEPAVTYALAGSVARLGVGSEVVERPAVVDDRWRPSTSAT